MPEVTKIAELSTAAETNNRVAIDQFRGEVRRIARTLGDLDLDAQPPTAEPVGLRLAGGGASAPGGATI